MANFEVHALVLQRRVVFEADCLFTVFSREQGRMLVKARSVLKPLSKLMGGLAIAGYSRLRYTDASIPVVTSAIPLELFGGMRDDPEKLKIIHLVLEVLLRATIEGEVNTTLFDLVLELFRKLDTSLIDAETEAIQFLFAVHTALGFGLPHTSSEYTLKDLVTAFEYNIERKLQSATAFDL